MFSLVRRVVVMSISVSILKFCLFRVVWMVVFVWFIDRVVVVLMLCMVGCFLFRWMVACWFVYLYNLYFYWYMFVCS